MKQKAFTLSELLAVIVIIGLLAIITTPIFINMISDSKVSLNETQKETILSAARNYGTKEITLIDDGENKVPSQKKITLSQLQESGYLDDKEIKNLISNESIDAKICVSWGNNQFIYTYSDREEGDCE